MLFEFVLFAILGWCVFAWLPSPPAPQGKMVLMVLFVVLMCVWLVVGMSGYNMGNLHFPGR
jgi:heme A synthase